MAENLYTVSSSPHIRSKDTIQSVMRDVIIALIPAMIAGIVVFKTEALILLIVSITSCVVSEWAWQRLTKRPIKVLDLSAVITGILIALNVPPSLPPWMVVIGGVFAMIIVKALFGGLGQNIVNPALAARAFLVASYPVAMTTWTLDGVSTATPLGILKEGGEVLPGLMNVFLGNIGGCIGETSALALLIGFVYLLYRKVISWHIPVYYIGTVFVLSTFMGRNGFMTGNGLYEIMIGGLMIGAIFMATDYTTSPMTTNGKIIFAIGCGVLTSIIRTFGGYPEGVSYSILIMNLFVPLIDRYVAPRVFGEVK